MNSMANKNGKTLVKVRKFVEPLVRRTECSIYIEIDLSEGVESWKDSELLWLIVHLVHSVVSEWFRKRIDNGLAVGQ